MVNVPGAICGAYRNGQTARDTMDPCELNTDDTFDAFYARELSGIIRLAFVLTGSRSAAEDLAQDAFFDAYRRWSQIGRYDKPGTWVRRAVINRAVSVHRRRLLELRHRTAGAHTPDPEASDPLVDHELWAEVRRLPHRQAQAIALHYLEQLTTAEIAALLDISQAAVKTHLQRGRDTLAQRLEHR